MMSKIFPSRRDTSISRDRFVSSRSFHIVRDIFISSRSFYIFEIFLFRRDLDIFVSPRSFHLTEIFSSDRHLSIWSIYFHLVEIFLFGLVDCACTRYDGDSSFGLLGSSSDSEALLLCFAAWRIRLRHAAVRCHSDTHLRRVLRHVL